MLIPKIMHHIYWNFQTYDSTPPEKWLKLYEKSKEIYNDYQHILWNKKMADEFITTHFSFLLNLWNRIENIEKVDTLKYAIMYIHGGIYIDMDTTCLQKWTPYDSDELILNGTIVPSFLQSIYGINNNWVASIPKHNFWLTLLVKISNTNIPHIVPRFIRISMTTGPYILQTHYRNNKDHYKIRVEKGLSVSRKFPYDSNIYFLHESTKSWINFPDIVHLSTIFSLIGFCIIFYIKADINYAIIWFIFLFAGFIILLYYLLCRKHIFAAASRPQRGILI